MRSPVEVSAIVAGIISVTVALSWNEVARAGVAAFCPGAGSAFACTLGYAVASTLVVVVATAVIRAIAARPRM